MITESTATDSQQPPVRTSANWVQTFTLSLIALALVAIAGIYAWTTFIDSTPPKPDPVAAAIDEQTEDLRWMLLIQRMAICDQGAALARQQSSSYYDSMLDRDYCSPGLRVALETVDLDPELREFRNFYTRYGWELPDDDE
jgi:hypothetical protein